LYCYLCVDKNAYLRKKIDAGDVLLLNLFGEKEKKDYLCVVKNAYLRKKIDAGDENRKKNVLAEAYPQQAQRNDKGCDWHTPLWQILFAFQHLS